MQTYADILVLTRQPEKAANLGFLLRLANYRSLHIADDIEAFNYLVQRRQSLQPIRLLVIVDADPEQPILHLLDDLKRSNSLVPILLVRGAAPLPINQMTKDPGIISQLHQCDASMAHSCVRELLGSSTSQDNAQAS